MTSLLSKARAAADAAEIYTLERSSTPLSFQMDKLESINTRHTRGLALRVIRDGKLGFASSTDFADEEAILDAALTTAAHGDAVSFDLPGGGETEPIDSRTSELMDATLEDLVDFGETLAQRLRAEAPKAETKVDLERVVDTIRVANSSGLVREEHRSSLVVELTMTQAKEGDILPIGDSVRIASLDIQEPERLLQSLIGRMRWSESVVPAPNGQVPAVFTPSGAIGLLLPIMIGSSGSLLAMGATPLENRIGEQVLDPRLSIFDDATLPGGSVSRSFDDEGLPTRRTPLMAGGVFSGFYHDLTTASQTGQESTGNGYRSTSRLTQFDYRWPPGANMSNIVVGVGDASEEDLLRRVGDGVLIDGLLGLGQGNLMAGEFSNNIGLGFLVQGGKVVGRIKNAMVAGNAYQLLKEKILAVGSEPEWVYGQIRTPAIALTSVSVSS